MPRKAMRISYLYDLSLIQRPSSVQSLRTLEWPTRSSFPVLLAHVQSLQGRLIQSEAVMGRPFRDYTEMTKIHGQERNLYTFSEPNLMCSLLSDFRRGRLLQKNRRTNFGELGFVPRQKGLSESGLCVTHFQQLSPWGLGCINWFHYDWLHAYFTRKAQVHPSCLHCLSRFSCRQKNPFQVVYR